MEQNSSVRGSSQDGLIIFSFQEMMVAMVPLLQPGADHDTDGHQKAERRDDHTDGIGVSPATMLA